MNPNNTQHLQLKKLEENDFEDEEGEEDEEESGNETQPKKKKTSQSLGHRSSGKVAAASVCGGAVVAPPRCLVMSCENDLSGCKKYHQRHRVCEVHAKAPVVLLDGLSQRFCQQCSRFHELAEFDHTKRSCRRRLAGHNERRRKSSLESRSKEGSSPRVKEIYH